MRKLLLVSLFIVSGCCPLVKPSQTMLSTVGVEYRTYVENDTTLSEDDKRIRLQNLDSYARAVHEASK